jgi:hypothetical protein
MKPLLFTVILVLSTKSVSYYKPLDSIYVENQNYQSVTNHSESNPASGPTLRIDHEFKYNNPMMNYTITVRGEVPINEDYAGFISCCQGKGKRPVFYLSGSGIVNVYGKGSMHIDDFQVKKLNYNAKMRIQIKGKTTCFEEPELFCLTVFGCISLEETWLDDIKWDIVTSDPENDDLRINMFKQIAPTKIPVSPHTGRTLKFNFDHGSIRVYEHESSAGGVGTFKWQYSYVPSNAEQYYKEVNPPGEQLRYDETKGLPKDYPVSKEELGPPLESIIWDLIDLDK